MAVEHAMFTFEDLKVNSCDDRQTDRQNDRMTTKVLSSRPRIYMWRDQLCILLLLVFVIKMLVSNNCIISLHRHWSRQ